MISPSPLITTKQIRDRVSRPMSLRDAEGSLDALSPDLYKSHKRAG